VLAASALGASTRQKIFPAFSSTQYFLYSTPWLPWVAPDRALAEVDLKLDRYFDLDFNHWRTQMDALREFFWSQRVAQWAPVAGLIAVLSVRRGAIAALLGGWLAAFLVVKGFSPLASIESGSFWRLLMPAWPAYLLLFAAIPLLVPTLARRLGDRVQPATTTPVTIRWIGVAIAVAVGLPAVAIAASSPLDKAKAQAKTVVQGGFEDGNILTPVDGGVRLTVRRDIRVSAPEFGHGTVAGGIVTALPSEVTTRSAHLPG